MRLSILWAVVLALPAGAQTLTFDSWCNDIANYPAIRCAEQKEADVDAFNRYSSKRAEFQSELDRKQEREEAAWERTNRMGDVTPDQAHRFDNW